MRKLERFGIGDDGSGKKDNSAKQSANHFACPSFVCPTLTDIFNVRVKQQSSIGVG
jgi:hypothetical protein